jgi:ribulose kinase
VDSRSSSWPRFACWRYFSTARPLPDHTEHQSEEIWRAVCAAVRAALAQADVAPADVAGLAFDATCSLAMFDAAGGDRRSMTL